MARSGVLSVFIAVAVCVAVSGCGISKDRYESVLNEKIALEEKVGTINRSREALKNEYDNLLNEKMDLATKVEALTNEKSALRVEYDKILDEKIMLRASYDKLEAESRNLQEPVEGR